MHKFAKSTILFILVALASLGLSACKGGNGAASAGSDDVAATVNGKNIMMKEVTTIIHQQMQGQESQLSPLELAAARIQVLDGLIQNEVLFQRAEKDKLLPTEDEVTQALNNMKTQSGMTEEDFQKQLKDQNQTLESLREETRKTLAIQKLQDKTTSKITISDKEVEDFYNNNKAQFVNARGVGLAEIVVDPADNGATDDAKSDTEAKVKIDNIYQTLKSGADFASVARARSEDPSNVRGGDIGFATEAALKQNGFPQDLITQFFGPMQAGSYTSPVQLNGGRWYIFKLQSKQLTNENLTLDSPGVRQKITQALTDQRKQVLNQALLEVAMYEAKIVNNLAAKMVDNPANLSGPRPAQPAGSATPTPTAAASPQATAPPAPAASATPNTKPTPAAKAAQTPRAQPSPKQ